MRACNPCQVRCAAVSRLLTDIHCVGGWFRLFACPHAQVWAPCRCVWVGLVAASTPRCVPILLTLCLCATFICCMLTRALQCDKVSKTGATGGTGSDPYEVCESSRGTCAALC